MQPWGTRLEKKINTGGKTIGILHNYFNTPNPSNRVRTKAFNIAYRANIKPSDPSFRQKTCVHLESLKQKIPDLGNRLRRYRTRTKRYRQDAQLVQSKKQFYRSIEQESPQPKNVTRPRDTMNNYLG